MYRLVITCLIFLFVVATCTGSDVITLKDNVFKGYNIYKNGHYIGSTRPNLAGSFDLYNKKGRLLFKGYKGADGSHKLVGKAETSDKKIPRGHIEDNGTGADFVIIVNKEVKTLSGLELLRARERSFFDETGRSPREKYYYNAEGERKPIKYTPITDASKPSGVNYVRNKDSYK